MVLVLNYLKKILLYCEKNKMNVDNFVVCFGLVFLCFFFKFMDDYVLDFKRYIEVLRYFL